MARTKFASLLVLIAVLSAHSASAQAPTQTLVLPLRSIGVSDTTIFVSHDLLVGSLQDLGIPIVNGAPDAAALPSGADACDAPECAAALGRERGAAQVVYGSLSKLGDKIIARVSVVRVEESAPYYRDQLSATSVEDLDQVMRRFAEGIASGRPNSDRATVESVTQAETQTPKRRATRGGFGIRAGFLFPTGNSFGGVDRMTSLRPVFKYELPTFQLETTTMLGFTWGDGCLDWTLLDVTATRILSTKDFAPYFGGGIGVHSVTVERKQPVTVTSPYYPSYTYDAGIKQTETAPTADLVAGFKAFRTYDFEAVIELRFHYVFEQFSKVGGDGANGFMITFGTSR